MRALNRIDGEIPKPIRDDVEFLRANLYLAQDKPEESMQVFEKLENTLKFVVFSLKTMNMSLSG